MYEVRRYVTRNNVDPVQTWLERQRSTQARLAVQRRLIRLTMGNLGDHKFCRDGVWELRIDLGPGYRIYYALDGREILLLLCAGDKSSQAADICKAAEYLQDWKERKA